MSKKGGYEVVVRGLLERFLHDGDEGGIEAYLASNSNLPGPRGNLELSYAFADVAGKLSLEHPQEMWSLASGFVRMAPDEAPVNDPMEIVPFCGAVAAGAIGAARDDHFLEAIALLKKAAEDPRWRTREGVAMGLQRLIEARGLSAIKELEGWVAEQDWLAMRAAAAGVAEPALLKDRCVADAALELHRSIVDGLVTSDDRRNDAFRVLRQALGYSLSVVVASRPQEGFEYMRHLAELPDPDVQWILKENLKKNRLIKYYPDEVHQVKVAMVNDP